MKGEVKNSYIACKRLYRDIIFGYSEVRLKTNNKKVFLKHLDELDSGTTDKEYEDYLFQAKESGLKTEEESLSFLLEEGLWTKKQEQELSALKEELTTLESTKRKLIIKSQRDPLDKRIKPIKEEVYLLSQERTENMGLTAEGFASKKVNEFMVHRAFFKSRNLDELLYSEEEFDILETDELTEIMNCFADTYNTLSDEQMKLISVCPFFMNTYSLCGENPHVFFNKPIVELTNFQISLLSSAKYVRSLMNNSKPPPEDYYKAPKSLFEWYELQDKSKQVKDGLAQKGEVSGSTVVGASKSEIQSLQSDDEEVVDLNKLAQEKGEISFEELMDLHGL